MTAIVEAWERFWFKPEETSTLALVRILYGFVLLGWSLTLTHDAFDFFSGEGVLSNQPDYGKYGDTGFWGLLGIFPGKAAVVILFVVLISAAASLIVGLYTRLATVAIFICLVSLQRRNLFVYNSGDALLKVIALYLMLAPAGTSLSLDRLRRVKDRFWEFPARAPWALRLLQLQLSIIYLSTVWAKVRGITWNNGTAVSYAMRVEDLARFQLPHWFTTSEVIANIATFGTLAIELGIGILIWNRKLRPWIIPFGILLHLGIDTTLRVGFFSYAMFVLYAAFIPPETASAWILAVRDRLKRSALGARLGRQSTRAGAADLGT